MIIQEDADSVVDASLHVTEKLLHAVIPDRPVIIKPNIVGPSCPPVTTDVRVVEGIVSALSKQGIHNICVAEGSGTGNTMDNFRKLGYERIGVKLIDLDNERPVEIHVENYNVWKSIFVPHLLLDAFIISVPVLKEHSLCGVTVSLKNMVGILSAHYYSGYWTYKKSLIHKFDSHGCIADIISAIRPDWAIVDATIGMKGSHLSGTPLTPPLNLVYGSEDPLEADIFGCTLLGTDWRNIAYLRMIANNEKGKELSSGKQSIKQ